MQSNEHSNLSLRPAYKAHSQNSERPYKAAPAKPHVVEETIRSERMEIERKTFTFTLKENPRGRFLRITEAVNGRFDNIIIPSTGLQDFVRIVTDMAQPTDEPSQPDHDKTA